MHICSLRTKSIYGSKHREDIGCVRNDFGPCDVGTGGTSDRKCTIARAGSWHTLRCSKSDRRGACFRSGWSGGLRLDRPADAAVSTTALHWLAPQALAALYAALGGVLRPGGLLLNGDHLRVDDAASPVLARLGEALLRREDERRFPNGHAESWPGWWDAVAAYPALAGPVAEREAWRDHADHHGWATRLLATHIDALRAAGFTEAGTLWQRGENRLLCAVRGS